MGQSASRCTCSHHTVLVGASFCAHAAASCPRNCAVFASSFHTLSTRQASAKAPLSSTITSWHSAASHDGGSGRFRRSRDPTQPGSRLLRQVSLHCCHFSSSPSHSSSSWTRAVH